MPTPPTTGFAGRPTILVCILLAVTLMAAGCVSSGRTESQAEATTSTAVSSAAGAETVVGAETDSDNNTETAAVDDRTKTMLDNLAIIYRSSADIWPGFDPGDHPTVVGFRDGGSITIAVAVNHPNPDALGEASPIDVGDAPFKAHHIADLSDPEALDDIAFFDFNSQQGGVDSFVMVADSQDQILRAEGPEFATTYIHEMFHRYQIANFNESFFQDFENYPYTAENLELAALEGRALKEALGAETDQIRDEAARRFAAIRMARRAAHPEVVLDDSQEIGEGTARFIEHRAVDEDFGSAYHRGNVADEVPTRVLAESGVKEIFGFGRFYATGAAAVELIDRIGVTDMTAKIEANQAPASILAEALGVTDDDVADLVAEAKANYDPLNELAAQAEEGAEAAKNEPAIFAEDELLDGEVTGEAANGGPQDVISDDELQCLLDQGADIDAEGGIEVNDEIYEACFG